MGIPKHKPSAKQKSRAKYQSENRLAKNKERRQKKHEKRLEYFKKRREKRQLSERSNKEHFSDAV